MSDTTQTQDPWATAPVDAGAAPANDAAANAGDAWSSAPAPAAHD
ncbi:proline/betaine ABC transporter permease ProW, partial [Serratia marcescens]|nr:proline/betaine ABC transporter permease ProW [Serratia marcescens]